MPSFSAEVFKSWRSELIKCMVCGGGEGGASGLEGCGPAVISPHSHCDV